NGLMCVSSLLSYKGVSLSAHTHTHLCCSPLVSAPHTHTHTLTRPFTHPHPHTHTHTPPHTHTTHTHTHIHTYTQTHMRAQTNIPRRCCYCGVRVFCVYVCVCMGAYCAKFLGICLIYLVIFYLLN